jgi:flagellar biogenesis protein FliO
MTQEGYERERSAAQPVGGLAGWLLGRLRSNQRPQRRLAVLERITLAPKQSLALVEAEGRKFLVATSSEGTPAFYPLDERTRAGKTGRASAGSRISW